MARTVDTRTHSITPTTQRPRMKATTGAVVAALDVAPVAVAEAIRPTCSRLTPANIATENYRAWMVKRIQ